MKSLLDLVGRTPMAFVHKEQGKIFAKLEMFNPMSSVKDRIAFLMIKDAEDKGLINKDTIIIEPTSGNTGIGLSWICAIKGYKLKIVMPDSMSIERRKIMKALGAEIVLTPGELGMKGSIEKAKELLKEYKNSFMPDQFSNPSNPLAHYKTTGPEIWKQMEGKIDVFVAGVGTGGTITGVGKFLKEKNKNIKIIAVEPSNSAVLSGKKLGKHKIQGIGAGFIPKILDVSLLDEIICIEDEEAKDTSLWLSKKGFFVGLSSGAAMAAALKISKRSEFEGKNIVTIFADHGERYLSTYLFENIK